MDQCHSLAAEHAKRRHQPPWTFGSRCYAAVSGGQTVRSGIEASRAISATVGRTESHAQLSCGEHGGGASQRVSVFARRRISEQLDTEALGLPTERR